MNNKNILIIGILLLVLVASVAYYNISKTKTETVIENTTQEEGYKYYHNAEYELTFRYPEEWILQSDDLGNGSVQLLNYDINTVEGGHVFPPGYNKIEAVIFPESQFSDNPDVTGRKSENISINGYDVIKEEMTSNTTKIRSYKMKVPNDPNLLFNISIAGSSDENFHILDELVRSIEWESI